MPKAEKKQELWKTAGGSILCALGIYLVLQFLGALLLHRQVVGEGQSMMLVWASAAIAMLLGVTIMGRKCTAGRLLLGAGSAMGFTVLLLLLSVAAGNSMSTIGPQLAGISAATLIGGVLAAMIAAPRRGKRNNWKRR